MIKSIKRLLSNSIERLVLHSNNSNKKRLSLQSKRILFKSLANCINSGLEIQTAINIMLHYFDEQKIPMNKIQNHLQNGNSFTKSLNKEIDLNHYEIELIDIAENSANLQKVFNSLSDFYYRQIKLRKEIIKLLIYPIIVLATALASIVFMLIYIVPLFETIYLNQVQELPWISKKLIFISNNIEFLGIFILSISGLLFTLKSQTQFQGIIRYILTTIGSKFPNLFQTYFIIEKYKFFVGFKLMIISGLDFNLAIRKSMNLLYDTNIRKVISNFINNIENGANIDYEIEKLFFLNHNEKIQFIIASNNADFKGFSLYMTSELENQLDHSASFLTKIIEPVLLLIIGGIVCIILVSLYLPIFKMSNAF